MQDKGVRRSGRGEVGGEGVTHVCMAAGGGGRVLVGGGLEGVTWVGWVWVCVWVWVCRCRYGVGRVRVSSILFSPFQFKLCYLSALLIVAHFFSVPSSTIYIFIYIQHTPVEEANGTNLHVVRLLQVSPSRVRCTCTHTHTNTHTQPHKGAHANDRVLIKV